MNSAPLAIRCRQLTKTYPGKPPVEAVRGLDLEIPVGECFGLLGPNGAGKTSTMEILEGLSKATSGDVEILGRRWGEADRAIRAYSMPREEALAIPDVIRTATNLLPPEIEIVRIVDIAGLDVQADGGTHVASTRQVGRMRVAKVENKGKGFRRVRIELAD